MSVKINMNLDTIYNSGQCFRMFQSYGDSYVFIQRGHVLQIEDIGSNHFKISCTDNEWEQIWSKYFDADSDIYDKAKALIDPSDKYLYDSYNKCVGLRILNQDPFEVAIEQILEQRNTATNVINMVADLSKYYGTHIRDEYYSFPTPSAIAGISTHELELLGAGYRAAYIRDFAISVANGYFNMQELYDYDDDILGYNLQQFKGIGPKVAASIAVQAYHRLAFFPVDTWIKKVFDKYYPNGFDSLEGEIYEKYGAIAQMCMRTYARSYNGLE